MKKTKHSNSLKRDKMYYFKYCNGCKEKYMPTSGGQYCEKCKEKRAIKRLKNG